MKKFWFFFSDSYFFSNVTLFIPFFLQLFPVVSQIVFLFSFAVFLWNQCFLFIMFSFIFQYVFQYFIFLHFHSIFLRVRFSLIFFFLFSNFLFHQLFSFSFLFPFYSSILFFIFCYVFFSFFSPSYCFVCRILILDRTINQRFLWTGRTWVNERKQLCG